MCECQTDRDCHGVSKCDGCNCLARKFFSNYLFTCKNDLQSIKIKIERDPGYGCEHCPPGVQCDPITGACIKGKSLVRSCNDLVINLCLYPIAMLLFCTNNFGEIT